MPAFELMDDPVDHWHDDEETLERHVWDDGIADLYLHAEEVWPQGVSIRDIDFLSQDGDAWSHGDEVSSDFDD
jgi:hypothetical protein